MAVAVPVGACLLAKRLREVVALAQRMRTLVRLVGLDPERQLLHR